MTWLMLLGCITIWAQGVKPLPTLHVDGKWLADTHGNYVVLHGVMDTPNMYFNGWRWGSPWDGSGTGYNSTGVTKCLAYFEKIFTALEKAKCNVFRLHLDPAWTNDPSDSYTYPGAADQPAEATSEADIKKFNPERLRTFLSSLYWPLMRKSMNHGMYVVVRPPGVCPPNLKVGDYYQQYLLTVWDMVSQNANVKKYAGQISIELANEPVNVKNANNQDDPKALHDYFQPIVDKIRENGFTGIIWVPGTGWQSNYTSYAKYPITGDNIGYAVHDYNGWYGCDDKSLSATDVSWASENKIAQFHNQVPVIDTNPILVSEIDWSPENPNAEGHYDEHGVWVLPNYGTWATGRTSVWGHITKNVYDHYENVSMTLSGTGCLIDIDAYLNNNVVTAAFGGLEEACGKACMDWYADYYNVNWPHADDEEETGDFYTLAKIEAEPGGALELMPGDEQAIRLTATYLDGHTRDITGMATYDIDDPTIISFNDGVIKALKGGTAAITASFKAPAGEAKQVIIIVKVYLTDPADLDGKTFAILGATSNKIFYGVGGQDLGYEDPAVVLGDNTIPGYQFKAEKIAVAGHSNCYLLRLITLSGEEYSVFGKPGYLNTQDKTGECCFISGLTKGNGEEIENGAVWEIYYIENNGFAIKNVGTNLFLKDATPAKYRARFYFNFRSENPTDIITVPQVDTDAEPSADDTVYSLQGVRMGTRRDLNLLPGGLYVVGGKKVLVK